MRYDTATVNGLLANVLGTSQSATVAYVVVGSDGSVTFAVDVAVRHSDNSETAVGTKVAQATHNQAFASGVFEVDGTWAISPAQSMVATDNIVVRVYGKIGAGSWSLLKTFGTERLGASQLDAVTWTIHYAGYELYLPKTGTSTYSFYFGTVTYNSRVENFTWSIIEVDVLVTDEDLSVHFGFEWDEVTYTATVLDEDANKLPASFVVNLRLDGVPVVSNQALDSSVYSQSTGLLTLVWYVPSGFGEGTVDLQWAEQEI
jgi:hypothetical protein